MRKHDMCAPSALFPLHESPVWTGIGVGLWMIDCIAHSLPNIACVLSMFFLRQETVLQVYQW